MTGFLIEVWKDFVEAIHGVFGEDAIDDLFGGNDDDNE